MCLQHLLNIAWCDGMHPFVAHGYALLLDGILPPDRYCVFIAVYWQPWTVFCKAMVAISCPSSCPRYFCPIPLYSVRGIYFSKCLPKSLWGGGGGIFRGGHFCVTMPCFYHLQRSYEEHKTWGVLQFMALGAKQCLGCKC